MKKKLMGLGLILVLLLSTMSFVFAEDTLPGYTTNRFDVDVQIEENHVMHVTETIEVDFGVPKHGIYRYVPFDSKFYKVENLMSQNDFYEVWEENGKMVLQIGDADETIMGKHTYTITYDLVCYEDDTPTADYLSLDLLPPEWETPIHGANMTIHLPKSFDMNQLQIYSGAYGADINAYHLVPSITDDGKKLYMEAENLAKGHGVTISAQLPEEYWVHEAAGDRSAIAIAILLLLVPLVCLLMWVAVGRDPKVVKTVEFYPPEGMTPAEIGYIVDGGVQESDLTSMIVYFADKGYLEIHEYEEEKFELIKKMPIPETEKTFAKTLFDGYFAKGDTVNMEELSEDLAKTYELAMEQVEEEFQDEREVHSSTSVVCWLFSGLLYLLMTGLPPLVAALKIYAWEFRFAFVIIGLIAGCGLYLFSAGIHRRYALSKGDRICNLVFGSALLCVLAGFDFAAMMDFYGSVFLAVVLVVCSVVTLYFFLIMRARTTQSAKWQGKVLGFRDFIETAELDKLKRMAADNPNYFYHVMPYAFVFGLSDVWMKQFSQIPLSSPTWYTGYGNMSGWDVYWYSRMMNRCMYYMDRKISDTITTSNDKASSGGFRGGGFSGGGFGGGGGGSW